MSNHTSTHNDDICVWSGGALLFDKINAEVTDVIFNGTGEGGIVCMDSTVNVKECEFSNTASVENIFSSVQHNMVCRNSELSMDGFNGAAMTENALLWLYEASSCVTLTGSTQSTYFVPILSELSIHFDDSSASVGLSGTVLIPCNLSSVIRISSSGDEIDRPISDRDGNETFVLFSLILDSLLNGIEEISVSLKYAPHSDSPYSDFVEMNQLSVHIHTSSFASHSLSTTLISIISASSSAFLIIVTVIIIGFVCIYKRRIGAYCGYSNIDASF